MLDEDLDSPGKRLRYARERAGFRTAKDAAKKARIGDVSWRAYENDQHGYSRHATKIAQIVGVSVEWLLDGGALPDSEPAKHGEMTTPNELAALNIELVRKVDISYAMGDGAIVDEYPETEFIPFNMNFLRQFARGPVDRLFLASGQGESMEPTLRRDDLVMVDASQSRVAMQDQIWALSYAGTGMIKRLRRAAGGRMIIFERQSGGAAAGSRGRGHSHRRQGGVGSKDDVMIEYLAAIAFVYSVHTDPMNDGETHIADLGDQKAGVSVLCGELTGGRLAVEFRSPRSLRVYWNNESRVQWRLDDGISNNDFGVPGDRRVSIMGRDAEKLASEMQSASRIRARLYTSYGSDIDLDFQFEDPDGAVQRVIDAC